MKRFCLFVSMLILSVSHVVRAQMSSGSLPEYISLLNDSLRNCYAPDHRVALFDVDYVVEDSDVMLRGATTSALAKSALLRGLRENGYRVIDHLQLLPDSVALEGKTYGVVNVSVCNIHTKADFASPMSTQGLLGMPVRILQHSRWFRIQTPDGYIDWVHPSVVVPMDAQKMKSWNDASKVIVTAHYGLVYTSPDASSSVVSDVVAGNRLKLEGTTGDYYSVSYPDGRRGYLLRALAMPESAWRASLRLDATALIRTALSFNGIPYLWAGLSPKGVDCSGLVRLVFFMYDVLLPRDASQQARVGERINILPDFSNVKVGDLIFFGRPATADRQESVTHVAIYMGKKRFIHAQGDVHVSSFDVSDSLYDEFNHHRLLYAVRILPYIDQKEGIETLLHNRFYK